MVELQTSKKVGFLSITRRPHFYISQCSLFNAHLYHCQYKMSMSNVVVRFDDDGKSSSRMRKSIYVLFIIGIPRSQYRTDDCQAFIKSSNMRDNYEPLKQFKRKYFVTLCFGCCNLLAKRTHERNTHATIPIFMIDRQTDSFMGYLCSKRLRIDDAFIGFY